MGLVEEGIQANPARSDVCGGQREDVLAISCLSAVVNGVDLPETGCFPFLS
jgi:hypothetical protein